MSAVVTVETKTQWETATLLRKLRGYRTYAVQLDEGRWLVRSPLGDTPATVDQIRSLVAEWAAEEGAERRAVLVGGLELHIDRP